MCKKAVLSRHGTTYFDKGTTYFDDGSRETVTIMGRWGLSFRKRVTYGGYETYDRQRSGMEGLCQLQKGAEEEGGVAWPITSSLDCHQRLQYSARQGMLCIWYRTKCRSTRTSQRDGTPLSPETERKKCFRDRSAIRNRTAHSPAGESGQYNRQWSSLRSLAVRVRHKKAQKAS